MTVYQTLISEKDFSSTSDVAISTSVDGVGITENWPLSYRPLAVSGIKFCGLNQKTIFLNRKFFIQWAGSKLIAQSVVRSIAREKECFRNRPRDWLYYNFSEKDLEEISLHALWIRGGEFRGFVHNAKKSILPDGVQVEDGLGAYLLQSDNGLLDPVEVYDDKGDCFLEKHLDSIVRCIIGENGAYSYHGFRTGGWYELIKRSGAIFEKLPYAIFYWSRQPLLPVGIIYSRYVNDLLVIDRVRLRRDGTAGREGSFAVGNFLTSRSEKPEAPAAGVYEWPVIIHLFYESEESKYGSVTSILSDPTEVQFQFDDDKCYYWFSRRHINKISQLIGDQMKFDDAAWEKLKRVNRVVINKRQ